MNRVRQRLQQYAAASGYVLEFAVPQLSCVPTSDAESEAAWRTLNQLDAMFQLGAIAEYTIVGIASNSKFQFGCLWPLHTTLR